MTHSVAGCGGLMGKETSCVLSLLIALESAV